MLNSFLQLLRGEKPARAVWTADITYWMAGRRDAGSAAAAWATEKGHLQLHRDLGVMPYYEYEHFFAGVPCYSRDIEVSSETVGDRVLNTIRTPAGDLTDEHRYLRASSCLACTKHGVESERDLDVLLYILEHRRLEPANIGDYLARRRLWAEYDGLPALGLPRSPLPAFVYEWAGLEQTAYLLADCAAKVNRALSIMEEQEEPILDALCELAPPLVHFPDNLSGENLGGFYDSHMAERHVKRLMRLHAAGIKCVVHLDGTIKGLLPKLVGSGFDAIEALTPAPVGDLELGDIRGHAGSDTVILWGGVPGAMFAPPYTWQDMEAHVRTLLQCWQGRPFVVGVADQVPPDGDIDFCRRIAEMLA